MNYDLEASAVGADDERWLLVQRVAASPELSKAPQLREILLYITRRALADHPSSISEQEIGCKVLGRRADFNPNDDNIVRVQVRHLRRKLEEYFNSEGSTEPIILTIPKGGYLPRFEPHPVSDGDLAERGKVANTARGSVPPRVYAHGIAVLVWVILAGLAPTLFLLWRQKDVVLHQFKSVALQTPRDPFWSKIFTPARETTIVISDSCLVMAQDITDTDVSLNQYLNGAYPQKLIGSVHNVDLQSALRLICSRQYTSLGDATITSKLMDVSRRYSAHTNIRYARYLNVRDFKVGNFILVGSRRGIPEVQLFEPELNYYLEQDRSTHKYHFRNRQPQAGERTVYTLSSEQQANATTYADIALLPNCGDSGYVLLLSGIDMAATEAAGDLTTSPEFPATLSRLLNSRRGGPPASYIEILLEVNKIAGTADGSKVVSYRLLNPLKAAF